MKTKIHIIIISALSLFVTGCKTTTMSRNTARAGTSSAILLTQLKEPRVTEYIVEAAPIVCMASGETNRYSPQQIVDALTGMKAKKNPTIAALINSILAFYAAAYEENQNSSSAVLEGICLGMKDALLYLVPPPAPPPPPPPAVQKPKLPPHIE